MPLEQLSHFDEKSGAVVCATPWGRWWQTVAEIHIEVNLPPNTRARDVAVKVTNNYIECSAYEKSIFKGTLFRTVHGDETAWTIEDRKTLTIILSKADYSVNDEAWTALMEDGSYRPDMLTAHEMRQKLDLERFQIENPQFDFSRAKLQKAYDKLPGWSIEAVKKQQQGQEGESKPEAAEGSGIKD
ncbi:nudC domain-containing protein 2-like [Schistocerca americana]|uniref:nudC domain-containing protein 2-like n=1 Tax=Schistocerca americana TaxID=7009 RepID=UPI001F4F6F0B|nr:nudC domain-containing protein 2-like [Schistocerca americana]XP_047121328.1 nudC domain-containing protein 2-like [Schistocerca piceifrons]XP_049791070.1 nudC domain-containing protein 2-like [Schistocerca nitens]XP_049837410.1 nudC domain-containing protein 2-like [Schistocerca gregaria]